MYMMISQSFYSFYLSHSVNHAIVIPQVLSLNLRSLKLIIDARTGCDFDFV